MLVEVLGFWGWSLWSFNMVPLHSYIGTIRLETEERMMG
jgi:hypothetical protein